MKIQDVFTLERHQFLLEVALFPPIRRPTFALCVRVRFRHIRKAGGLGISQKWNSCLSILPHQNPIFKLSVEQRNSACFPEYSIICGMRKDVVLEREFLMLQQFILNVERLGVFETLGPLSTWSSSSASMAPQGLWASGFSSSEQRLSSARLTTSFETICWQKTLRT